MNIATVGDIDSGKTTLTDLLMFLSREDKRAAKGSIEAGTTLTDIGAVEVARGITINSVPVQGTFVVAGKPQRLTIIDTPGHKEFSYQVEAAVRGLDGILYIVDANKPFKSHSAELLYLIRSAGLPVIAVLNKIDLFDEFSYQPALEHLLGSMEGYGIRLQLLQSPVYQNRNVVAIGDGVLGLRPVGLRKEQVPDLSAIVASQLKSQGSIPAVLTSGAKGIGANELLAYIFGLFHQQQQPKPQQSDLQIRVINRLPKPRGGGSVVAMVLSGELRRGAKIPNPGTGEDYKLSRLYDPNGRPIRTASLGDIVLLGGLDNTNLATGQVLGAKQAVNDNQNLPQSLVGVELNSPEAHRLVEALKRITRWDQSWSYDILHNGVMAYAFDTFHLGVLTDILRQEFKIPVTAKPFEPRYVAKPAKKCEVEGCVFRGDESYVVVVGHGKNGRANQSRPEQNALEKMTRQLQQHVAGLKWFGRFPIEELDVVVEKAFSPTGKASEAVRQQALKAAVENLLYNSQAMALHEPHVGIEILTMTREELQRVEGYFKRWCPHSVIRVYTAYMGELEYDDWAKGLRQTFPNEADITMPMRDYLLLEVGISKLAKNGILRLEPEYYEAVPPKIARQVLLQSCGKPSDIAVITPTRKGRRRGSDSCYTRRYQPTLVTVKVTPNVHADGIKPQNFQTAKPVVSYDPVMPVMAAPTLPKGGSR